MSQSEHDLSDNEASPSLGGQRPSRNRSTRGIFNDLNGHAPRARQGWVKVTSTLKSWSSNIMGTLQYIDWKGNGRLLLPTLGRALQLTAILTVLIAVLIRLKYADKPPRDFPSRATFPFRYNLSADPDTVPWDPDFGSYNVILEMHSHTYLSDGSMSPEQMVEWAIAYGYTAVVVSDHNNIYGGLVAKEYAEHKGYDKGTILVIPAVEYTCCRVHMNLIGINETIAPSTAFPDDEELKRAINRTHELGGIAVLNHWAWSHFTETPYDQWRIPDHPTREKLLSWGIDAFESANGLAIDLATLYFSKNHGLPIYAGGDIHGPTHEPHAWNILHVDEEDRFNQEAILKRFKEPGATSFLFNGEGPPERSSVPRNPAWDKWASLTSLDFGYLYDETHGMYSFTGEFCHEHRLTMRWSRGVWFIVWVTLAFLIYEVVRAIVSWAWAWFMRRREGRIRLPLGDDDGLGL